MGKKGDTRRHIEKMKKKRALKERRNAYYDSLRASGKNKKSKRFLARSKAAHRKVIRRRAPDPTNMGCLLSHPELNLPALVRDLVASRQGVKNQWSSRYRRQVSAFIVELEACWPADVVSPATAYRSTERFIAKYPQQVRTLLQQASS